MNKEEWRAVTGYEGLYEVSNLGNIINVKRNRLLRPGYVYGYQSVSLSKHNIRCTKRLHRLIAKAFIPNPENKPAVNHIDGNKANNAVSNLEWVTDKENTHHAMSLGTMHSGERSGSAKLKIEDVLFIRASNISHSKLAKMYNVHQANILSIVKRKSWKNI